MLPTSIRTRSPAASAARGELVALANAVLKVLEARGLACDDDHRAIVLACSDRTQLEDWLVRSVHVRDADELRTHTYAGLLFEHETRPRPGGYPRRAACARHARYLGGGGDAASRVRRDGRICWLKDRSTRLVTSERGSSAGRGRGGGS